MTTFTREQLIDWARGREANAEAYPDFTMKDLALIEIALAAMQQEPVVADEYGDAYQGAREDLAIWKRRALEAEEHARQLEKINDHLVKEAQGESRMGEPVIAMQQEPVAWRYRYHNGLAPSIWKYADSEQECNAAPNYQRQPLYTAPQPLSDFERKELDDYRRFVSEALHECRKEAQQPSPVVSEVYALVPVKETLAMAVAGGDAYAKCEEISQYPTDAARRIWAAMVAAAPLQGSAPCTK